MGANFSVGGVTVALVSVDLLTADAGNSFDQVVAVVVDPEGRFVDFDGDDLADVAQSDLDALADDLGTATAGHGALHPDGALVEDRARPGWGPYTVHASQTRRGRGRLGHGPQALAVAGSGSLVLAGDLARASHRQFVQELGCPSVGLGVP
jgi:hypothetical protein